MQVFVFTDSDDFKSLLEVEGKDLFGVRPVIHESVEDLKFVLSLFQSIDCLLIDLPMDTNKCSSVLELVSCSRNRIKKIFLYGDENKFESHFHFYYRSEISELFGEIKKLINPVNDKLEGWTSVPLRTLIHFESLPFDLYIKLSDQKYIKRIPAYESVGTDLIKALETKGIISLFCERKFKRDFSMMLINNMINKVDKTYSSINLAMLAQSEVMGTTKEIIQKLGITGRVIEVCEASVDKMVSDVMKGHDELSEYLKDLQGNKDLNFHFKLISLTNYIATQLILDMKLKDGTEQIKKLVFASYFCDMTLKNPAFLYHRKAEDSGALNLHEQNEVNFHALKASELVAMKDIPKEVAIIIRQHHGSFSGIGFPQEKSNQLLPLSKILIVSQDLAFAILSNSEASALEVFRAFLRKNKTENLQELLKVLENSFSASMKTSA